MAKKRKLDEKPASDGEAQATATNGSAEVDPDAGETSEVPPLEDAFVEAQSAAEEETLPAEQEHNAQISVESTDPAHSTALTVGDTIGGDDVSDEPEPVQKLLEPLTKEQLIEIISGAASRYADVMEQVQRIADIDPVHRKIFVHGLGWETNADVLASAFRQYGEIEDCNAVRDKATGKSKGYGFILFKHRSGARRALKEPQKKIGNRMTACQLASAGPVPPPAPPVSEYTQRKIYVSNVSADLDPQKLKQFFSTYGEIEEGPLGLDKQTGKPKGFALFVYKTIESAKRALEEPHKNYEGHILHCQKAIDGPKLNKPGWNQHHGWGSHHQGAHHGPSGAAGGHGSHFPRAGAGAGFVGGNVPPSGPGHLMAPSGGGLGFNQGTAPGAAAMAGINPALGQALTALLTTPAAGMGLTNLLGPFGSTGMAGPGTNQAMPPQMVNSGGHGMQGGYANQAAGVGASMNAAAMGGYGGQAQMPGGYGNAPMSQSNAGRGQQGGHIGGIPPYMGH